MSKVQVTAPRVFKEYEISEITPPITKQFTTCMTSSPNYFMFSVSEDMRKFIKQTQHKFCKQETPIQDRIFSNQVYFSDADNNPKYPIPSGNVLVTLSIPRLVKKGETFYPKVAINKVCI